MIKKLIFLFIFYFFMSVNFVMAEKKSLSNYLWENRLLIISFEKGDNEVKNSSQNNKSKKLHKNTKISFKNKRNKIYKKKVA